MGPGFRHLFSAGAVVTLLAAGCNAVLGIEKAELIADGPGGGSGNASSGGSPNGSDPPQVPPLSGCDGPDAACAPCLTTTCRAALDAALLNNDARKAINKYRMCLGPMCRDDDTLCLEALTTASADQVVTQIIETLVDCIADCGNCFGSPLIETRELYCNCMLNSCGLSTAECPTFVPADLEQLGCRLLHCEFAAISTTHCAHARGEDFCPPPEPPVSDCTFKNKSNYPCDVDDDCCSRSCSNQICD